MTVIAIQAVCTISSIPARTGVTFIDLCFAVGPTKPWKTQAFICCNQVFTSGIILAMARSAFVYFNGTCTSCKSSSTCTSELVDLVVTSTVVETRDIHTVVNIDLAPLASEARRTAAEVVANKVFTRGTIRTWI